MAPPLTVSFVGSFGIYDSAEGAWSVDELEAIRGEGLTRVEKIAVIEGRAPLVVSDSDWVLRGTTGAERYVNRAEREALFAIQPPLGRAEAGCAALIPVRKSEEWWGLAQDERREIFEERSHHTALGLKYLPAIARRLHHSRELGEEFDFLTWFEFEPRDTGAFEELVAALRETLEWSYVEREVDIRLSRPVP